VKPFHVKGGSGRLSESLGRCIEHHGGRIRRGALVETVTSRGGRVTGVRLAGGEEITASKGVVGCIHPHDLGRMVEGVDKFVARQAANVQLSNFGAFNTHLALHAPPEYLGGAEVNDAMMVECVPTGIEAFRRSFDELRYGRIPAYDNFNVACISRVDPSQVPDPKNASLYLYKFAPLQLAEGGNAGWAAIKDTISERYIKAFSRYATNMSGNVIARYSETPQDMYAHNPVFKYGDIFGVGTFLNQFFSYRPTPELGQYRVPGVAGLYLSGPTTHPGGGVTGGGRAPAIAMMTDMGMSLAEHFS
jgi:phytoene dehydrogenase-like protein